MLHPSQPPHSHSCDLFISFGSEDEPIARKVHDFFARKGLRIFFSEETIHDANFLHVIDDALDRARCLITVATKPELLRKQWVQYEWTRFFCDILNGYKPEAQLLSFISGIKPRDLPGTLRARQYVMFDRDNIEASLPRLERFVPTA